MITIDDKINDKTKPLESKQATNSARNEAKQSPKPRRKLLSRPPRQPIRTRDAYGEIFRSIRRLTDYTYDRTVKFPKHERLMIGLGSDVNERTANCLQLSIGICAYNPADDREQMLRQLSVQLKTLQVMVELCKRRRYINGKVRDAWLRMLVGADNSVIGLAMHLEKQKPTTKAKSDEISKN